MQINRGGTWAYMMWDDNHQIGRMPYMNGFAGNVFTITKAVDNGDGTKTVQIMGEDGSYFPTLGNNGNLVTMGTAADYTLSKNSDNYFHLKNGSKGVDNNSGFGLARIVSYDYAETGANQQIRIYEVIQSTSNLTVSSIPTDILGNPVTDGGTYAIRMPGRAANLSPNRYLTGSAANNYIVHAETTFDE
ncbi:MAG: hypothetical protein IJM84_00060, partial [Bacteroidaceae bacterium]|nr:hypothetical protein [Bacteroidaceae bacterium]